MTQLLAGLFIFGALVQNNSAVTYKIAPGTGEEVQFVAHTPYESYSGKTDQVSGDLTVLPEKPTDGVTANISVKLGALNTGNKSRDKKMRTQYLEVDKFPTAKFTVTKIVSSETGGLDLNRMIRGSAQGTFTLHGVTRQIAPEVLVTREKTRDGKDSIHVVGDFTVKLGDYGIATPKFLFFKVKQDHNIHVDLHAIAVQ